MLYFGGMKRLSEQEYQNLSLRGKGRSSELFNALINLRKGEAVLIEQKDWNRKAGPGTLVRYIEKKHQMKFVCAAVADQNSWVVKRIDDGKPFPLQKEKPVKEAAPQAAAPEKKDDQLLLRSEITIFYLGRISAMKIERIEETLKAVQAHFIEESRPLVRSLLLEIIELLAKQQHIVIENEKTYLPLKRN